MSVSVTIKDKLDTLASLIEVYEAFKRGDLTKEGFIEAGDFTICKGLGGFNNIRTAQFWKVHAPDEKGNIYTREV